MTKRQENIRIKKLENEWDKSSKKTNDTIDLFLKYVKKEIKIFTNFMMYRKRPSDKIERLADTFTWWFIIIVIFFALKGFTYWLTGR